MISTVTRLPPQDLDAERGVLGSVMLFGDMVGDVSGIVQAADFYLSAHQSVFAAILKLGEAGTGGIDALTVSAELERLGQLSEIGGNEYLIQLVESVPHAAHAKYYAELVREKSRLRTVIYTAGQLMRDAYESTEDADTLLRSADSELMKLIGESRGNEPVECTAAIAEFSSDLENRQANGTRLATGLSEVDRLLSGGLPSGCLTILGAGTSVGKSALAVNIAGHVGSRQHTLIFSLEMSAKEYFARLATSVSRIPLTDMERAIETGETSHLSDQLSRVAELQITVDHRSRSLTDIVSRIRGSVRARGTKLVVLDYLQLVTPTDRRTARHEQIGQISGTLQALSAELDISIIALSQLSRAANEDGVRPALHHLRESGSIEQDAAIVLLLSRKRNSTDAVLEVAKHRGGPTGIVSLTWRPDICRYDSTVSDWCDTSNFDPLGDS